MKKSAGILLYQIKHRELQFFLVHPGGPFWKNKDAGAWSVPKGEFKENEDPLTAALREFEEETGTALNGNFMQLTPVKQKSGKIVYAWAVEGDIDAASIHSNTFKIEWPPKSGKWQTVPEVDKAGWFHLEEAIEKINTAQRLFLHELKSMLSGSV